MPDIATILATVGYLTPLAALIYWRLVQAELKALRASNAAYVEMIKTLDMKLGLRDSRDPEIRELVKENFRLKANDPRNIDN